jgi:hypothetical protein
MASTDRLTRVELPAKMAFYYALSPEGDRRGSRAPSDLAQRLHLNFVNSDSSSLSQMEHATNVPVPGPHFDEIYNGYLYSGASNEPGAPAECAGFALDYVLGMRDTNARSYGKRSTPTVQDFDQLHDALVRRAQGDPNASPRLFGSYMSCFQVVNLRAGEQPAPGDFVSSEGHIVIVKNFNASDQSIDTIEAASGRCGSVCSMRRPLLESPCGGNADGGFTQRPLRADLRVLRFVQGEGCHIRSDLKQARR